MSDDLLTPGVYEMADVDYFRHPALSVSGAKLLLPPNCPAIYHDTKIHPEDHYKEKPEFDEGHAAHELVLGAGNGMVRLDFPNRSTNAYKAAAKEARAAGLVPLLPDQWEKVHRMADAVRAHPSAGPIFTTGTGKAEQVIRWDADGVPWRGKVDWLPEVDSEGTLVLVDYKTAADAEPEGFARAAAKLNYPMQDFAYSEAASTLPAVERVIFLFVVTMKTPPFLSSVIELEPEDVELGGDRCREAGRIWKACRTANHWPDWTNGEIVRVGMPGWWRAQNTDVTEQWDVDGDVPDTDERN